jgi:5-hydroxyisourate hydrolase-like protein (transthyretin family)
LSQKNDKNHPDVLWRIVKRCYFFAGGVGMSFPNNEQFQAITVGGVPYADVVGDINPAGTDIVGSAAFPSFYFAYDEINVYFRMRVRSDPRNSAKTAFANFAWGVLINTTGVAGTYDWLLAVNGLNNRVNLVQNTVKQANSWNDPAEGTNGKGNPNYSRSIINFDVARVVQANSTLGNTQNYFIDFLIPASTFFSFLGVTALSSIRMVAFTAANNNNYNKDSLRTSEGFQFQDAFSNPVTINSGNVRANLQITKTLLSGPVSPDAGQIGEWTGRVTLTNIGKSTATIINVTDTVSLDVVSQFTVSSVSQGATAYNSSSKTLTWSVGNIAPGASAILNFAQNGTFFTSGSRILNSARATGFDSFTGGDLTPLTANITVNVQATGGVAGTILDSSNGQSVTGATVRLISGVTPVAVTATDAFGKYSFTNISPATYTIEFSKTNYTTLTQGVVVQPDTITIVNPILTAFPGALQGTVTSSGGPAVNGAQVFLSDTLGTVVAQTTTSPTGSYSFASVIPGHYTVTVSADGFQSATIGQNIPSNQTTTANFVLQTNPGTVAGTITGSGAALAGAFVEALSGTGITIATATTDGAGQYSISRIAPGSYRLRVSASSFQTFVVGFSVGAGQTTAVDVNLLANPGSIAGTVTDEETGAPLAGTSLKIVNSSGITDASVTTDVNGQYTANSLAPGYYVITFSSDGHGSKTVGTYIQSDTVTTVDVSLRRIAGVLTGTVTSDGAPITGATVDVVLNNIVVAKTITDDNGDYTISGLSPDRYTVILGAVAYSPVTLGAVIQDNETSVLDADLQSIFGSLAGNVQDDQGNNLPGAVILVKNVDSDVLISRKITDTNGDYAIGELSPGSYIVTASSDDYQASLSGAIISAGSTSTVNFSLEPNPSAITGTIVNLQTGEPIIGASIEIQLMDSNGLILTTTFSDVDGNFVVEDLMPSTYTIIVSAEGFRISSASLKLTPGSVPAITIGLNPTPGFVTGTMLDSLTGLPIAGGTVNISNTLGVLVDSALTSSDGTFISLGLPNGFYTLTAVADGFETQIVGVLVPNGLTKYIDIELSPNPGTILGTVTPAADGLVLQLYTMDNQFVNVVAATPAGLFQFQNLAPGNYIVNAVAPNFAVASAGALVIPGQATNISLTIQPNPGTIFGTVVSDLGEPVSNVTVSLIDVNETPKGSGTTDIDGSYTISNVPVGSYAVVLRAIGYAIATGTVSVDLGQVITDLDFQLDIIRGSISGSISDFTTGAPIPGATILVRDSVGVLVRFTTTDQFGNFVLRNFVPGSYSVTSSAQNYSTEITGVIVRSDETAGADIQFLSTVGDIAGQITDGSGNPLSGDNIQLKLFGANGELLQAMIAQTDGSFQIQELSVGTYFVSATLEGYSPNMVAVIVNSGAVTDITISLSQILTTLTGTVTDAETGTPITGTAVSVSLTNNTGLFVAKQYTGTDGSFTFDSIAPGTYLLNVNAESYGIEIITVTVPIGGFNMAVSLIQNPGAVTGFVTNQLSGEPISNSIVLISASGKPLDVKGVSDSFGQFTFSNLAPDTYRAVVNAEGFSSQSATFTVLPDQTTSLSFILTPEPGTLTGTVSDAVTGNPIPQVTIQVRYLSPTGPVIASTLTDEEGVYITQGVYSGPYTVVAFTNADFGSSSASVFVPANDTRVVDFALEPFPATVEGTIRSESGEPLVNAAVTLLDVYGFTVRVVNTDSNGFYRVEGFTEGQYLVTAIIPDYQRQRVSIEPGPGEIVTADMFLIPEPGQISGVILDAQTLSPLVGAQVEVYTPGAAAPIARRTTGASGDFLIEGVAPRSYTINAFTLNYSIRSTGVIVRSNVASNVQLALIPDPASVSGTVTDNNGVPLSNVSVRVVNENDNEIGNGITDLDGNYVIGNLPQGGYTIVAGVEDYSSFTTGISMDPGQQLTGVDVVLSPLGGSFTGSVVSAESGEALPGVLISILTPEGIPIISTNTDTAGNFSSTLLAPGTYTVIASSPYFFQDQTGVIVLPNQTSTVSFALLGVGGTIVGVVVDSAGIPITDTTISVRLLNSEGVLLQSLLALADGSFAYPNLSAGNYQLNILAEGYQTASVGAIVVNGETANLVIALIENRGAIEGVIQGSDTGLPISGSFIEVTDVNGILVATVTSDQNGAFRLGNIQTGALNVRAAATGYGSSTVGVIVTALNLSTVRLSLSPLTGILSGKVTDVDGNPISNTSIKVIDSKDAVVTTVLTDGDGTYQIQELNPVRYTVTANAEGFGSIIATGAVVADQTSALNFILVLNTGSVTGNVFNSVGGTPLTGAVVELKRISPFGPVFGAAVSDSDGNYSLGLITVGTYTLTVTKENYGSESASILVETDVTNVQNFELVPNPSSVSGVVASGGTLLTDTVVTLIDSRGVTVAEIQTDADGRFFLQNFTPGVYALIVNNPDYQSGTLGFAVIPGQTATVNFELIPLPGILTGTVFDQINGTAIQGAVVQLFFNDSVQPSELAVTDASGTYVISGLAPGLYTAFFTAPNYDVFLTGVNILANDTAIINGFLSPNPGTVTGTVNGPDGVIAGADIKVVDVNGAIVGAAVSDAEGNYAIGNLPVGTYAITVTAEGFSSDKQGISISPGGFETVNFLLPAESGRTTGKVTNEEGEPLPGTIINISSSDKVIIASAVTDKNGDYIIEDLLPETYVVQAVKPLYGITSVGTLIDRNGTSVSDIVLLPMFGSVTGTVLDQNGAPITNQTISISLFDLYDSLVVSVLSQPDGTYLVPEVTPGEYLLSVTTRGFNPLTVAVTVNNAETTLQDLQLSSLGGSIRGTVIDSSTSEPVPGVVANIKNIAGIPIVSIITDQDGGFETPNVPPGTVIISVNPIGNGNNSQGAIVETGTETVTVITVSPITGDLTGRITDPNGAPVAGAAIQIIDATRSIVTTVLTQSDGRYAVRDLFPGIYTMIVSAPDFEQKSLSAFIEADETTVTNLALGLLPGSVEGVVTVAGSGAFIARTNVELRLISSSGPVVASTLTDTQGRYRISSVPAGSYTVVATNRNYGNDSSAISVQPSVTAFANLQLSPVTANVSGRVTNSDGSLPLVNTLLRLADQNGVVIAEVQTNVNGNFVIEGLLPGEFSLTAINQDYRSSVMSFTASPNNPSVVNFNLVAIPSLFSGVVTDADTGKSIVGAIVETFDLLNRPVAAALTNINGFYTIAGLSEGTYTLRASAQGYGSIARQSTLLVNDTKIENFALPGNPAAISGTITIVGNGPLSNASVNVYDENGVIIGNGSSRADGTYFIGNLPAGTFTVTADTISYLEQSTQLTLARGENRSGVNFALRPGADGDITGQVSDSRTGNPLAGVRIQLFDIEGNLVTEITTNEAGVFSLLGVPAGSYELRVSAEGYVPFSTLIQLRAGEELLVPISLRAITPVTPVSGQYYIVTGGGQPLSLDSVTSPTRFNLVRIDSARNLATFSYDAVVGGTVVRRSITFNLTCISIIRFIS